MNNEWNYEYVLYSCEEHAKWKLVIQKINQQLGGGFKYLFIFDPYLGKISNFD